MHLDRNSLYFVFVYMPSAMSFHFIIICRMEINQCPTPALGHLPLRRHETMQWTATHHPTLIIVQFFAWAIYTIAEYNMQTLDTHGKWSKAMEVVTVLPIYHILDCLRRVAYTNDMHLQAWPSIRAWHFISIRRVALSIILNILVRITSIAHIEFWWSLIAMRSLFYGNILPQAICYNGMGTMRICLFL